ncbi:C6 finger domain-containing protein [Colletotrichum truncatum]|uniref:C6 finger domain-containing protein n=1 Tax=Colletotrichum truncatum TaxID=5467 RepID=A0ACC3Z8K1_COLTU|nr:C6 finger domain-containing protein [Colletotrichum truncatum]KAF6789249.1 C6 finger domain-containing protein [Colletotrichum truncatum]
MSKLIDEFCETGYLTLTGRSGEGGLMKTDVIPMRNSSRSLRYTFAAYQASLVEEYRHLMPTYLQMGISGYIEDLHSPDGFNADSTLATGILLCSVSLSALYTWTPLIRGLHAVLQQRELLSTAQGSPLTDQFIEVIGLLDVQHFTLNRFSESLRIWSTCVAPRGLTGVQETSGLPYSLLNLICELDLPGSEEKLHSWPGEPCQELIQVHLWEAFRSAAILHCRVIQSRKDTTPHREAMNIASPCMTNDDLLRLKVLAACQAIMSPRKESFPDVQPLGAALLYPLFIVGLFTEEDTVARGATKDLFSFLTKNWESYQNTLVWEIVTQVWERSTTRPDTCRLKLAEEFAAELNIEIYLY